MIIRLLIDPFNEIASLIYFDHYDNEGRGVWYGVGGKSANYGMTLHDSGLRKYPIIKTSPRTAFKFNKIQGLV